MTLFRLRHRGSGDKRHMGIEERPEQRRLTARPRSSPYVLES
jgi:hypothetical protein